MSTQQLIATGGLVSAIVGSKPDGTRVVPVAPSYSWSQQYGSTPALVNIATGSFTSWLWIPSPNDFSLIRDIELQGYMTTQDNTNILTVHNPFHLLSQLKLYVNGQVLCWAQDAMQIEATQEQYLRDFGDPEIYVEVQKMMNNASPLAGDAIAYNVQTPVRWSMMTIFPALKNILLNLSGLQKIQFDVTFVSNTNSLENTKVGRSSTTANAYNSQVSFGGLQWNVLFSQNSDARMLKVPSPLLLRFNNFYTSQVPNVSWVNPSDSYLLQLNTAFPQVNKWVQGISVWAYDNVGSGGAYNAATAAQRYSGSQYFSYVVRSRGNILYDVSQPTAQLNQRRRYEYDVYKSRCIDGSAMPLSVATNTDTLGKYFVKATYIDLANIIENDTKGEEILSGRDTLSNDITIQFSVGPTAISANVTLYFMLEYDTVFLMKNNGSISQI